VLICGERRLFTHEAAIWSSTRHVPLGLQVGLNRISRGTSLTRKDESSVRDDKSTESEDVSRASGGHFAVNNFNNSVRIPSPSASDPYSPSSVVRVEGQEPGLTTSASSHSAPSRLVDGGDKFTGEQLRAQQTNETALGGHGTNVEVGGWAAVPDERSCALEDAGVALGGSSTTTSNQVKHADAAADPDSLCRQGVGNGGGLPPRDLAQLSNCARRPRSGLAHT
jgi:hypothetical protein